MLVALPSPGAFQGDGSVWEQEERGYTTLNPAPLSSAQKYRDDSPEQLLGGSTTSTQPATADEKHSRKVPFGLQKGTTREAGIYPISRCSYQRAAGFENSSSGKSVRPGRSWGSTQIHPMISLSFHLTPEQTIRCQDFRVTPRSFGQSRLLPVSCFMEGRGYHLVLGFRKEPGQTPTSRGTETNRSPLESRNTLCREQSLSLHPALAQRPL